MTACENCGCRVYSGICSNCCEELYILEHQAADIEQPLSEEFLAKAAEQRAQHGSQNRHRRGVRNRTCAVVEDTD